jgi:hypothetical protein
MKNQLLVCALLFAAPSAFADATTPPKKEDPKKPDDKKPEPIVGKVAAPESPPPHKVGIVRRPLGHVAHPHPVGIQRPVGETRADPEGRKVGKERADPEPHKVGIVAEPDVDAPPPQAVGTTAAPAPDDKAPPKKDKPAHGAPPKP